MLCMLLLSCHTFCCCQCILIMLCMPLLSVSYMLLLSMYTHNVMHAAAVNVYLYMLLLSMYTHNVMHAAAVNAIHSVAASVYS